MQIVGEVWPRLFEPDHASIAKTRPDVVVHGFWGGDTIAFMRQALAQGLFDRTTVVSFDAGGNYDVFEALQEQLPEGLILSSRHHNNFPDTSWNREDVRRFHERASRYPSYAAHGAYVGVHFIAQTLRRAGRLGDPEAFVAAAEGSTLKTPKDREGFTSWIRAVDHQIVQEQAIGVTEHNEAFPPARRMLGQWTVVEAEQIIPDEDETRRRQRAAIEGGVVPETPRRRRREVVRKPAPSG